MQSHLDLKKKKKITLLEYLAYIDTGQKMLCVHM